LPESRSVSASAAPADIAADLDLLREAAAGAASIAMRYFGQSPSVRMKHGNSPVTEADLEVNAYLCSMLGAHRPDYGWLSEETDDSECLWLGRKRVFVVDPIDGTRAFLAGEATWCISVAVVEDGTPMAGVLHCPATHEVFHATKGGGALRNGKPILVSGPRGGGYLLAGPKPLFDAAVSHFHQPVTRHAPIPSLAYRLAMVADGRLDGTFIKPDAHDWDIAAAMLILSEAGGALVDIDGLVPSLAGSKTAHGFLVAASAHVLQPLLAALRRVDGGSAALR
jgi:myo-inositol-1(or 4)-monophosphatase